MKADLHIHTTKSDGSETPIEVVHWARNKGLDVMAITDHDSVDGLDEGRKEAEKLGIKFVDGIELSTFSTCEIHVLGYNIDYKNPDFVQELRAVKDMRKDRNKRIAQKLQTLGIDIDIDFDSDGVGRMNMARAMVKAGYCKDTSEAFDKYLGVGAKAYCECRRLTPVEAVKLVKKYGGFASVAHPQKVSPRQTSRTALGRAETIRSRRHRNQLSLAYGTRQNRIRKTCRKIPSFADRRERLSR